jgi:hypothetical protein
MRYSNITVTYFIASILSACSCSGGLATPQTNENQPAKTTIEHTGSQLQNEMRNIVAGNPVSDADQALKKGDKRLWAYHNRSGKIIPAVEGGHSEKTGVLALKIAPGMSDVIYNKEHQKLRQKMLDYMLQYNQRILESH